MKFLKVPLYQIYSLRTRDRRYVDISIHNHAICTKQTYSLLFLFTTHYAIALITSAILSAIVARQFSTCSCLLTAIFSEGFGIGIRGWGIGLRVKMCEISPIIANKLF